MEKEEKRLYAIIAILLVALVLVSAYAALIYTPSGDNEYQPPSGVDDTIDYILGLPYQNLSADEIQGLQYMREEEKLARDVYLYSYEQWGTRIFDRISMSEQMHTDLVGVLLAKYNLSDPYTDEPGVFHNATLQALYNNLTSRAGVSETEALTVGANIEELDIVDIQKWVDMSDNEDINYVYHTLMSGSENHLRAFVKALDNAGVTYVPVYLSQEEYEAIINS